MSEEIKSEDLTEIPQEEKEQVTKKIELFQYQGIWVKGCGGNLPVILINPEFLEDPRYFHIAAVMEDVFRKEQIKATVLIPARPLIHRKNIKGLKDYALKLITEINEKNI